jgi:hypothetical protein
MDHGAVVLRTHVIVSASQRHSNGACPEVSCGRDGVEGMLGTEGTLGPDGLLGPDGPLGDEGLLALLPVLAFATSIPANVGAT